MSFSCKHHCSPSCHPAQIGPEWVYGCTHPAWPQNRHGDFVPIVDCGGDPSKCDLCKQTKHIGRYIGGMKRRISSAEARADKYRLALMNAVSLRRKAGTSNKQISRKSNNQANRPERKGKDMTDINVTELVARVNKPIIGKDDALEIVSQIQQVITRGNEFKATADAFCCAGKKDIDRAGLTVKEIDADIKLVTGLLAGAKKEAHARHKLFTSVESLATGNHAEAKKAFKTAVAKYVHEQQEIARREQERLQREENERAERERQALLKKAESSKRDATKEKYAEQAAEVAPVTVHVEAPKATGMNLRKRIKATVVDLPAFLRWAAEQGDDCHPFVEINTAALERGRKAYAGFKPDGVRFDEVLG